MGHRQHYLLAGAVAILSTAGIGHAADGGSYILLRADAGISIQRTNGKTEPAAANRVVSAGDQLCFGKAQTKAALKHTESDRTIEYTGATSGCHAVKDIAAKADESTNKSSLSAFKQVWAALNVDKQRDNNAVVAATRSARGDKHTPRRGSPFCEVPAYTDWYVLDSLAGITIPTYPGVTATLTSLSADGKPAGTGIAMAADGDLLRLPSLGTAGQVFQISMTSPDKVACQMRVRIVAASDKPEIAAAKSDTGTPANAADAATHALSTVYQHGRAWSLEALRQVAPHQNAAEEAKLAAQYLAAPNAECANVDTDRPVRFDMPILRAKKSYLTDGERALYLAWRGGKPPYRIVVDRSSDGVRVLEQKSSWQCEVLFPATRLTPGAYRIMLTDAKGEAFEENSLEVVPVQRRPVLPGVTSWLDQAQWLAEQQDGAWRFEATQTVAARLAESTDSQAWIFRSAMTNSAAK